MSPSLSIIIPSYKDDENVIRLVAQVREQITIEYELIVVQSAGTLRASDDFTLLSCEPGRAKQLNAGARAARAPRLLFLHADSDVSALSLDKPWLISIKRKTTGRSLSANGLLWKWMSEAGAELGYDKNDLHETMKVVCDCPITEINLDGRVVEIRSTSRLSSEEFTAYMDRCYRKLAGDLGLYLTLPEERQCHK